MRAAAATAGRSLPSRVTPGTAYALARDALPLGLAQGAKVIRAIAKGEFLTYQNCVPDERQKIVEIRREQDALLRAPLAA